jgi:hypothetical protein
MDTIKYYLNYLDAQFTGFPIIIRVTVFLIMLLAGLYLMSLLRIIYTARLQQKEANRIDNIKKRYESKLSEILFSNQNLSASSIRTKLGIRESGLKKWEKKHFTNLMLEIINKNKKHEIKHQQL